MTLVVPLIKGAVPHLTADLVRAVLTEQDERYVSVSVFDACEFAKLFPAAFVSGAAVAPVQSLAPKHSKKHNTTVSPAVSTGSGSSLASSSSAVAAGESVDFAAYAGLTGGFRLLLTVRSPRLGAHATAPSTNTSIAGHSDNGRILVGPSEWEAAVQAVQPLYAVPIYDSPFAPQLMENSQPSSFSNTGSATAITKTKQQSTSAAGAHDDTAVMLDVLTLQPPTKKRGETNQTRFFLS